MPKIESKRLKLKHLKISKKKIITNKLGKINQNYITVLPFCKFHKTTNGIEKSSQPHISNVKAKKKQKKNKQSSTIYVTRKIKHYLRLHALQKVEQATELS